MFRLYKAELKKIFLKPSIFVVTGLIILMLAMSTFLYTPKSQSNFIVDYNRFQTSMESDCNTVNDVYSYFVSNNLKVYSKYQNDELINNALTYLEFYKNSGNNLEKLKSQYQSIATATSVFKSSFSEYENARNGTDDTYIASTKNSLDTARNKFFVEYENLYSTYNSLVNNEQTTILVTKALNSNINAHYNKYQKAVYTRLEASSDYYEANLNYLAKLFPNSENPEFLNSLQSYINQIAPFEVDKDILPDLEQYVLLAQEKLGNDGTDGEEMSGLYKEIYDYYNKYITNDNVAYTKEIISMITDYNLLANYTNIIVTSSIKVNGLEKLGATDVQKYTVFANSNLYEMQEKLAKTKYLFDTNQYEYDFASVFSINQPSNTEINAFDYSYFALRLCTLFIIVYIVVLAAGTIAGEQSMGTMKLLAIRPYNRRKLLTGKILSILTIGAILLSVCSVATLVIGGINYGFDSALILCVFNASKVYTSGALSVYLVALLSMFIEIAFYAILSTFISTVFKSNIGAVTVSILLFFVSLVLNIIAINVPILRFLPFTNINLFKYFGASFVATNNAQSVLQGILTPTVFVGATFTLSIIMLTVTIVALLVATYTKFSKQDIK